VDFSGLELACVGHVTYGLFGESVHRDRYNEGVDLHAYLGAQLSGVGSYEEFMALKSGTEEQQAFFKLWRNFAKPVGLGFPGGLGPATMVTFARVTYGVDMTEDQARDFRETWRTTYPEMPRYFDWINGQIDYRNSVDGDVVHEYVSPSGLVRRGASYCAAANGCAMQSPGADAAMAAQIAVSRACYCDTDSVLYGCRPLAFVHDQIIGETTEDESLWADQCEEVARIMREAASSVLSSVNVRCDEALLTRVWSKAAKPVRDDNGRLIPWEPKCSD
jgi:hypothetical protein